MARKPMVTRTFITTQAVVLCLDIVKAEPFNKVVALPRTYKDEKKLMQAVEEAVNTDEVKAVHVVSKTEVETLYGMTEADFIKYAVELDAETRKPLDNGECDTEEVEVEAE